MIALSAILSEGHLLASVVLLLLSFALSLNDSKHLIPAGEPQVMLARFLGEKP